MIIRGHFHEPRRIIAEVAYVCNDPPIQQAIRSIPDKQSSRPEAHPTGGLILNSPVIKLAQSITFQWWT